MDAAFRRDVRTDPLLPGERRGISRSVRPDANDILFNPEGTIERVERAYEEQLETDDDDGPQASLAGERTLASIERVSEDLQANVEQFEAREDALRKRFQQVTN